MAHLSGRFVSLLVMCGLMLGLATWTPSADSAGLATSLARAGVERPATNGDRLGVLGVSSSEGRPATDAGAGRRLGPVWPEPSGVDAVGVAAGRAHTCAVTATGGVSCWGANDYGQLGNGTTASSGYPVNVVGLTGVTTVAAGSYHTCAVTAGGGLKCWGDNGGGQLGNGMTANSSIPVDVVGLSSGVTDLAAGWDHTCAVVAGGLKCWGGGTSGELGAGPDVGGSTTPVDVVGLSDGVTAVAAGSDHTCAVVAGGAWCWGYNYFGQVGDGTSDGRFSPVAVSGLSSGVTAVAAGSYHTCAVTAGGAKCWGHNYAGALGDGTTVDRLAPVDVLGLSSGVTAVGAGGAHSCAVQGGAVECWGSNNYGQLGDGTTGARSTPAPVAGLAPGVTGVASGQAHTCALTSAGGLECWGWDSAGQLGVGRSATRSVPVPVAGLASGATAVASGCWHSCALAAGGVAKCWGYNSVGQLGDGTKQDRGAPVSVAGLAPGVLGIAAGCEHTCGLAAGGAVKCWGGNDSGQLGNGSTTPSPDPVDVMYLGSGARAVVAGTYHGCALIAGHGVSCWGANWAGQLGNGSTMNSSTATSVSGLRSGVAALAAAQSEHACVLTDGGGVKCWGANWAGQLGDGSTTNSTAPVDVVGLNAGVVAVGVGVGHSCAVTAGGGLKCWGRNEHGELGNGTTTNSSAPVDIPGLTSGVRSVAAGADHICALIATGGARCLGGNEYGQLGDGTTVDRHVPTDVAGITGAVALVAGTYHTCAVTAGGALKCWGRNWEGQLGDGLPAWRSNPIFVIGFYGVELSEWVYLPLVAH